jgi:hypothetical protein
MKTFIESLNMKKFYTKNLFVYKKNFLVFALFIKNLYLINIRTKKLLNLSINK